MPSFTKAALFNTVIAEVKRGLNNQQTSQYPSSSTTGYPQTGAGNYGINTSSMSYPGGYPNQQGGYPGQSGHPGQPGGYPNQSPYPNHPAGYPQPGIYPTQPGGYISQPGSYPSQPGSYPNQPGIYPSQPGGYPGQPGAYPSQPGGYPNQAGGYPNQPTGYPGQPVQQGYPGSGYQPAAFPGQGAGAQYGGSYPQGGQIPSSGGSYPHPGVGTQNTGMRGTPTIRPYSAFNARTDSETLRKAMKGFGCDKNKVVAVLCARSNAQRQEIAITFKTMYGKDLRKELKSELSGDFEDLILGLMDPPAGFDAYELRKAIAGIGTKESVLIEIMCSRSNAEISEIRRVYRQMYKTELERDLVGDTSGYFQRLLVSMCAAGRDESMRVDPLKANHDARALYRAGEQRLGTDEACFNAILAAQNFAQLRLVFQEYQKISNHPIEKAIESEFSGDVRDGLLAIVACVQNRPAYFAKLLYNSMAGLGTRDTDLIRIVVSRSEIDLADIRQEFQRLYKKSLIDMIKGDCSGAYKEGLIALVKGN